MKPKTGNPFVDPIRWLKRCVIIFLVFGETFGRQSREDSTISSYGRQDRGYSSQLIDSREDRDICLKDGMKLRIALFDSGLGGIAVLGRLMRILRDKELYYLADHAYCPYGERSPDEIRERCAYLVSELLKIEPHLIVIACNTATLAALSSLKKMFSIPIVGIHPFMDYKSEDKSSVVALTTPASGKMETFNQIKKKVDPEDGICHFPCPRLADIVEEYIKKKDRPCLFEEIKAVLSPLKGKSFTHAILGCTHYEHIDTIISEILGVHCIYPSRGMVGQVMEWLVRLNKISHKDMSFDGEQNFYYRSTEDETNCFEPVSLKDWEEKLP